MRNIYLIRHGESRWNILKKIQGQQDISLTKNGIKQAHLIGNRLKDKKIDKIYSSDLSRALSTASIIGKKLNLTVTPMEEFRELKFGVWEGMTIEEILIEYTDEFNIWRREPENLKLDGAETLAELQLRTMAGINKIMDNNTYENILIVSHGVTIKTIILSLLNMHLSHFKNLTIDNVSLSIIENRDYNRVLKVLNDISHTKEI